MSHFFTRQIVDLYTQKGILFPQLSCFFLQQHFVVYHSFVTMDLIISLRLLNLPMQNKGYCIFYAEDDVDDQIIFKEVVESIDKAHELYIQNDGQELLDKLQNPPPKPQLVFLDLNMPKKNGIQTLREIRQSETLKDLTVIIFTTSDDKKSIELTKDLGASVFITKPSRFNSFKKAIAYCLSTDWHTLRLSDNEFVLSFN